MKDKYKDTDLREALKRKYADTPQLPADFMKRPLPRPLPRREGRTRRLRWMAAAACLLIIVGVGLTLLPKEEQANPEPMTAKQTMPAPVPKSGTTSSKVRNSQFQSQEPPVPKDGTATKQVQMKRLETKTKAEPKLKTQEEQPQEIAAETATVNELAATEAPPPQAQSKPVTLTERDIPITRPENYQYTPEEIALMKKQADDAYVKWVQLELEIAKYNLEQMAQQ